MNVTRITLAKNLFPPLFKGSHDFPVKMSFISPCDTYTKVDRYLAAGSKYFASTIVPVPLKLFVNLQAVVQKVNPVWYAIASGFSASYCFCLPVGTPGNLIAQVAAKIRTKDMVVNIFYSRYNHKLERGSKTIEVYTDYFTSCNGLWQPL